MHPKKRARVPLVAVALVAAAAVAAVPPAIAQTDARLAIRVTDLEGNPVADARVTVVSTTQGQEREFRTDEEGEYLQRGFRPNTYLITVEAEGFAPQRQEVKLNLGMNTVDVALEPATGTTREDAEELNSTYQQGYQAFQNGDYEGAVDAMETLLAGLEGMSGEEIQEVRASAYNILAASHMNLGQAEPAVEAFEKMLELKPESVDALVGLGQAHARLREFETGLEYFRRALELAPEDPIAHFNTGVLMIEVGELEEGLATIETATELRPEFPQAYKQLGYAYARSDQLEKAVEALQTYLEQAPEAPDRADVEGMITALQAELARQQEQDPSGATGSRDRPGATALRSR